MVIHMIDDTTDETPQNEEAGISQLSQTHPEIPKPNGTIEADNTSTIPRKTTCGVCTSGESQYKCSKCFLPYCSLTCSNTHQVAHLNNSPRNPLPSKPELTSFASHQSEMQSTQNSLHNRDPFASLNESNDLQLLFKLYPNLSNILEKIYEATLPPANTQHTLGEYSKIYRGRKGPPWTSDIGLQNGVKALHAAKDKTDSDGEGVRAYVRLVMDIIEGDSERSSAEQIRREFAEQDTKTIMKMLEGNF